MMIKITSCRIIGQHYQSTRKEMKKSMKSPMKTIKKFTMTTVLSTCLISSFVTPAFAAIDVNSLQNKIGNELQAEFHVTEADVVDTVKLSWDVAALNTALERYDLLKDEEKTVTYFVSPGADNDDDVTVSVLLKLPTATANALRSLTVNGTPIASSFSESGYNYYALNEGLAVAAGSRAISDTFDISFSQAAAADAPFSASLIAVKEVVPAVKTEAPGTDGGFWPTSFSAGETTTAQFFYYPQPGAVNGTAVIKLGDGITSFDVAHSSFTDYASGTRTDLTAYWDADSKTLTLPISVEWIRECYITLTDAVFHTTPGDYSVTVAVDQDGAGAAYSISDEVSVSLPINGRN
jgi:hypothetical protein